MNAAVAIAAFLWLHLVRDSSPGVSSDRRPLSGPDDLYGDDNDDSGGQVPGAIPPPELNAL
jgi:hypothetical protein